MVERVGTAGTVYNQELVFAVQVYLNVEGKGLNNPYTTSGQLKIVNARGGVKPNTKTFNQGLVVEYMDRAQGPTVDFFSQNLRGTHTSLTKSHCTSPRPL